VSSSLRDTRYQTEERTAQRGQYREQRTEGREQRSKIRKQEKRTEGKVPADTIGQGTAIRRETTERRSQR
jgi:hypothetical protein